jgi:fucose permease
MFVPDVLIDQLPPGHSARWRSLAVFLVAVVLTQTFWFNFAPLLPMLSTRYGITELTASYTILVFSLSNIALSSVAGMVIDKRGYRFSVLLGLVGMAAFACLRIYDVSFWFVLAGQVGISASVPFIFVAIPRVVADLFPAKLWPRINSFCSIGICVGSSSSLWLSPRIILGMGFRPSMILYASIAVFWCVVFAVVVPVQKTVKVATDRAAIPLGVSSVLDLFHIRTLAVLFVVGFIGQGIFTCVTTWMGAMWHERGFSSQAAGMGSSLLIIGGIFGCLVVPNALSRFGSYKLLLWTAFVPCIFLVTPFLWASSPGIGEVWGALMGFFYLSMMPTVYSMFAHYAPPRRLGAASGLYLMISSIGGIVVTVCFRLLKQVTGWNVATATLVGALVLISLLIALIRDSSPTPEVETSFEVVL